MVSKIMWFPNFTFILHANFVVVSNHNIVHLLEYILSNDFLDGHGRVNDGRMKSNLENEC